MRILKANASVPISLKKASSHIQDDCIRINIFCYNLLITPNFIYLLLLCFGPTEMHWQEQQIKISTRDTKCKKLFDQLHIYKYEQHQLKLILNEMDYKFTTTWLTLINHTITHKPHKHKHTHKHKSHYTRNKLLMPIHPVLLYWHKLHNNKLLTHTYRYLSSPKTTTYFFSL